MAAVTKPFTSTQIEALERELAMLAYHWRSERDSARQAELVQQYHAILSKGWETGWDWRGLSPDAELPDELMPEYFREYWNGKSLL